MTLAVSQYPGYLDQEYTHHPSRKMGMISKAFIRRRNGNITWELRYWFCAIDVKYFFSLSRGVVLLSLGMPALDGLILYRHERETERENLDRDKEIETVRKRESERKRDRDKDKDKDRDEIKALYSNAINSWHHFGIYSCRCAHIILAEAGRIHIIM